MFADLICGAGVVKRFDGNSLFELLGGGTNVVAHGYTNGSSAANCKVKLPFLEAFVSLI